MSNVKLTRKDILERIQAKVVPPLSQEKLERILKSALDVPLYELEKSNDEILYGDNSG